ncbi:hypothetical protein ACROYT_G016114 [Oculina patagonica]
MVQRAVRQEVSKLSQVSPSVKATPSPHKKSKTVGKINLSPKIGNSNAVEISAKMPVTSAAGNTGVAMSPCTETSNTMVSNGVETCLLNNSHLFVAGTNTDVLFSQNEASVLNMVMTYCLMLDMFASVEFTKVFIAPFSNTTDVLTDRTSMLMQHQFQSALVIVEGKFTAEAVSFLTEMGTAYPPQPQMEYSPSRYAPIDNTPFLPKLLGIIHKHDARITHNPMEYTFLHTTPHHKKRGVTSAFVVMDIDLSLLHTYISARSSYCHFSESPEETAPMANKRKQQEENGQLKKQRNFPRSEDLEFDKDGLQEKVNKMKD